MAEFSAVFYGLKFLVDKGFSKIMTETDSLEVLSIMQTVNLERVM